MTEKTPGQINYETVAAIAHGVPAEKSGREWIIMDESLKMAWEAGAEAARRPLFDQLAERDAKIAELEREVLILHGLSGQHGSAPRPHIFGGK